MEFDGLSLLANHSQLALPCTIFIFLEGRGNHPPHPRHGAHLCPWNRVFLLPYDFTGLPPGATIGAWHFWSGLALLAFIFWPASIQNW